MVVVMAIVNVAMATSGLGDAGGGDDGNGDGEGGDGGDCDGSRDDQHARALVHISCFGATKPQTNFQGSKHESHFLSRVNYFRFRSLLYNSKPTQNENGSNAGRLLICSPLRCSSISFTCREI